jgi:hypothetical protein
MFRVSQKFGRFAALASLAMMLQGLHSPLHHLHGEPHEHLHATGCCHHAHAHHDHYRHENGPADDETPSDSHECQLCQFLAQPVQLLSLPVVLDGHVLVVVLSFEHDLTTPAAKLCGPPVRGPPLS